VNVLGKHIIRIVKYELQWASLTFS